MNKLLIEGYRKHLCLIIIIAVFLCTSCQSLFPRITDEQAQHAKDICSDLIPPSNFEKTHQSDFVKIGAADRLMEYSSTAAPAEVEDYYVKLLTSSGWKYNKDGDSGRVLLRFKKDEYAVTIQYQALIFNSERVYLVSCSIGIH